MYPPMVYHDQIIRNSISGDFLLPPKAQIRTPLAANLISQRKLRRLQECHIEPDWLPIYEYFDDMLILTLTRTGSHSDLFR